MKHAPSHRTAQCTLGIRCSRTHLALRRASKKKRRSIEACLRAAPRADRFRAVPARRSAVRVATVKLSGWRPSVCTAPQQLNDAARRRQPPAQLAACSASPAPASASPPAHAHPSAGCAAAAAAQLECDLRAVGRQQQRVGASSARGCPTPRPSPRAFGGGGRRCRCAHPRKSGGAAGQIHRRTGAWRPARPRVAALSPPSGLLPASTRAADPARRLMRNAPSRWRCATDGGATRSGRRCERK